MEKRTIFNKDDIEKSIKRITGEIIEKNSSMDDIVLVGIRTGGAYLATRIRNYISDFKNITLPIGILDITLYRDDWTRIDSAPIVGVTDLPFSVNDKTVILIDDVVFTGRTVRAAMDALIDFGRPKKIELAVLVDRGDNDRELPIKANFVGGEWNISQHETVNVYLKEAGHEDHVAIEEKKVG